MPIIIAVSDAIGACQYLETAEEARIYFYLWEAQEPSIEYGQNQLLIDNI
jgi:hypothetical protein